MSRCESNESHRGVSLSVSSWMSLPEGHMEKQETKTGNGNWKWKLEMETGNKWEQKTHQSITGVMFSS